MTIPQVALTVTTITVQKQLSGRIGFFQYIIQII